MINLKNLQNQKTQTKRTNAIIFPNAERILKRRKKVFNGFENKIFPIGKQTHGKEHYVDLDRVSMVSDGMQIKILSPKEMFQKLSIALVLVKAGNTSENLLNEICQIIYFLYRTKEITRKYIAI